MLKVTIFLKLYYIKFLKPFLVEIEQSHFAGFVENEKEVDGENTRNGIHYRVTLQFANGESSEKLLVKNFSAQFCGNSCSKLPPPNL